MGGPKVFFFFEPKAKALADQSKFEREIKAEQEKKKQEEEEEKKVRRAAFKEKALAFQ